MSSPPSLRVQIGTFNCNLQGTSSYTPDLAPWLVPTLSEKSTSYASNPVEGRPAPDIYAIGFQELLPLPMGFAGRGWDAINNTDREIRKAIRQQSATTRSDGKYPPGGGPEDYALLARIDMVGIVLYVYARERIDAGAPASIAARVKEIRTATAGTGLLGLMGNKGGVGVRVVLKGALPGTPDEVLTFVCAHLAAHDHMVERRNRDWKEIVRRLVFAPDAIVPLPPKRIDAPGLSGQAPDTAELRKRYEENKTDVKSGVAVPKAIDDKEHSVYDTTHLFVFGDLNYRIAFNAKPAPHLAREGFEGDKLKKSDIKRKIQQADWRTLATYDQLAIEHRHPKGAKVFHGLAEPHLATAGFGPTYKFKVDKSKRGSKASAASDEKAASGKPTQVQELSGKRVPGWTDRILWASIGQDDETSAVKHGVTTELYRSIMSYTHSDHKPVTAILRLPTASPLDSSSGMLRLPIKAPFTADPSWRLKRQLGQSLDKLLGIIWSFLVGIGAGSLVAGLLELAVLVALGAYWLGVGGGEQGDFGWLLSSIGLGGR